MYFAAARDLASKAREEVQLADGASVGQLFAQIIRVHPSLNSMRSSVRFAVNFEVSGEDTILREGDEVGVLPPVAGG